MYDKKDQGVDKINKYFVQNVNFEQHEQFGVFQIEL